MVARALDGAEHGGGVVLRGFHPQADVRSGLSFGNAERDEDCGSLPPELVLGIRVDRDHWRRDSAVRTSWF